MKQLVVRVNFALHGALCYCFGHVEHAVSFRAVGLMQCPRCLRITNHKTVGRRVTLAEVERRMAANPPIRLCHAIGRSGSHGLPVRPGIYGL